MNKIDAPLIAALRKNARASVSELAVELSVSRATVRTRINSLQDSGKILGFTAVLAGESEHMPVTGVTMIEIEGKTNEAVVRALSGFAEVMAVHSTNGRWDVVVEFGTESLEALDRFLRRLRLIEGISSSETSLYLVTRRSSKVGSL